MEERAIIKKSVVGRHCVIGKMAKIVGCVILDHCIIEDGYVLLHWHDFVIYGFIERNSRVAYLGGARKLAQRPTYRDVFPKRGSRPMLEVNFPYASCRTHPLTRHHPESFTGSYRNAKLEISDWTTAGVYDDNESDEDEESEEDPEDV